MKYRRTDKFLIVALCTIMLILSLMSCEMSRQAYIERQINGDKITLRYDNFSVVDGGRELSDLDLQSLNIVTTEDNLEQLQLGFASNTEEEQSILSRRRSVPSYSITTIDGVDRMVIKIDGLESTSYADNNSIVYLSEVISGVLLQRPYEGGSTYLYISTRNNCTYDIEEERNILTITFAPGEADDTAGYYIKANAFEEYQKGEFDYEGFSPCISDDLTNGVMLCGPFDSSETAENYIEDKGIDISQADIVTLQSNDLPKYEYDYKIEDIISLPIGKSGDTEQYADQLLGKGKFLTWKNDTDNYLFARYCIEENGEDTEKRIYEELWLTGDTESNNIVAMQFASVIYAEYSFDNRYLAVIDQNTQGRVLYIFDNTSGLILEAVEVGYGYDTSSIAWAEDGYSLYAVQGEPEIKQIVRYDITSDVLSAQIVDDSTHVSSQLNLRGNMLYYLKKDSHDIVGIYSQDTLTQSERFIVKGNSFKISDDGSMMIVNDIPSDDSSKNSMFLYDLIKNKTVQIIDNEMVGAYTFGSGNTKVYFTLYSDADWEEEYPVGLYSYDIDSAQLNHVMDMITGAIYPYPVSDELILISVFEVDDIDFPVTMSFMGS